MPAGEDLDTPYSLKKSEEVLLDQVTKCDREATFYDEYIKLYVIFIPVVFTSLLLHNMGITC